MAVLIVAEHANGELSHVTRSVVTAAAKISGEITILVAGTAISPVAQQASVVAGVNNVIAVDDAVYEYGLAENMAELVKSVAEGYSHVLAAASTSGKDFMPRAAALLDVAQVSDIIEVIDGDTFKRPIYAGNAIATVRSSDKIKIITVRPSAFEKADVASESASMQDGISAGDVGLSRFVSQQITETDRPELSSAAVVVSGGRGVGSEDGFKVIYDLADKLNAAVGASRAAVDAGYVPNDCQVGQTGKVVAPDLYIAAGISGAIQHLAGMKASKVIVAINTDENAPIFEVADYGLVADLFDALPQLQAQL